MNHRHPYMRPIFLFLLAGFLAATHTQAQLRPTPEQLGSIYYAYPAPDETAAGTPAPEGYRPFYISHYGRHGSRWRTADEHYRAVVNAFDSLYRHKELTPLGEDVRLRLHRVWEDARGCSGNITPLGERQHHDIARRMMARYPEVFADSAVVDARSSASVRCVLSMSYFTEALKEQKPSLRVSRRAYAKYADYIAHTSPQAETFCSTGGPWWKTYAGFKREMVRPQRLMASLFTRPGHFDYDQAATLMDGLYWIAISLQNTELDGLTLFDIFEYDELFDIWRTINARMYVCNAAYPGNEGLMPRQAANLLRNIVESADAAVSGSPGAPAADLRFGHDTHLIRLLTLIGVEGCAGREADFSRMHEAWQDYRVSPMAANLQIIFFRNTEGDVLVKILHNEREACLPYLTPVNHCYYRWSDLKAEWTKRLGAR